MIAQRLSKASACLGRTKARSKRSPFSDDFLDKKQLGESALRSKEISMSLHLRGADALLTQGIRRGTCCFGSSSADRQVSCLE